VGRLLAEYETGLEACRLQLTTAELVGAQTSSHPSGPIGVLLLAVAVNGVQPSDLITTF